ncbi:MAG TPA: hypothetical protein VLV78_05140 [Thermoanaerobaculia bacterium]|nr:hypothetical protein [Thermoanaerobaculia bacterium]
MRPLLLSAMWLSLALSDARIDPILAIPITSEFLNDKTIRGYFADLLGEAGFGHWHTERAAFLVRDSNGEHRCVAWPFTGDFHQQQFHGSIPDGTVAIVHTHPEKLPLPSKQDQRTATSLSVPIFVLTPRDIYLVTSSGETIPVVENQFWPPVSGASSTRCSAATARASRRR